MPRRQVVSALMGAAICVGGVSWASAQERGGVLNVATVGELTTLDPMFANSDLIGMVSQHFYETLYTFDSNWAITPLLAEALPVISDGGKVYTIKLRRGVKFHDGTDMTSVDVVASINRWLGMATRGKSTAEQLEKVEAVDDFTIRLTLKQPYAPLLTYLALNNAAAVVLPSEKIAQTLTEYVGTGPYMIKERRVDQYLQLVRFDGYTSRAGAPDGFGGARAAYLDEIRFVPVPDANTRVEGSIAGEYDYADSLPVEAYDRLIGQSKTEPVVMNPFGWMAFIMNTQQGPMANIGIRKAIQASFSSSDLLAAAFGKPEFYSIDGSFFPDTFPWHSEEGVEAYNLGDVEKAKELAEKAGYDGKPIRILTSRQYEHHYKMALVAAEYFKLAGFQVELGVYDWATLLQRRTDPALWDIFIAQAPFLPEPNIIGPLSASYPGWWSTEEKKKLLNEFNTEVDVEKRKITWGSIQKLIYKEAPFYKVGHYGSLSARSPKLEGFTPSPWPYFWNVSLKKEATSE